jgi:hypothetical protein
VAEEICTLFWCEAVHEAVDGIPEGLDGSWFLGAQQAFSLAKACSIGFKSGLSGGMNMRLAPAVSMAFLTHFILCDTRSFMMTTSSLSQAGDENLLDISKECIAVDRAIKQAGRGRAVASKRAEKGRGLPAAVWHHIDHALVAGLPSYSRVMFLLVQVSSIKTSWLGMRLLVSHATPLALWRRQHGPVRPLGTTFFDLRSSVLRIAHIRPLLAETL